jgi:hypothetical protein
VCLALGAHFALTVSKTIWGHDYVAFPLGYRMPDFVKFSGDDNCTTWEHISQYTAQLGEACTFNSLKVRLFSFVANMAPYAISSRLIFVIHDNMINGTNHIV